MVSARVPPFPPAISPLTAGVVNSILLILYQAKSRLTHTAFGPTPEIRYPVLKLHLTGNSTVGPRKRTRDCTPLSSVSEQTLRDTSPQRDKPSIHLDHWANRVSEWPMEAAHQSDPAKNPSMSV